VSRKESLAERISGAEPAYISRMAKNRDFFKELVKTKFPV